MFSFSAKIGIIGINPYVIPPAAILKEIFRQAGKNKGAIQVKGTLNGKPFIQNLVKYSGKWRLYLNGPMREAAGIDVGDMAHVKMQFDSSDRTVPMHPKLKAALSKNKKAKSAFDKLAPSHQKEINRYINGIKTEEALERNIKRSIGYLTGKEGFVGRGKL